MGVAKGAFADDIKVFVSPASLPLNGQGEEFTVDVGVESDQQIETIKTFEVFLDYDPNILEVVRVTEGTLFTGSGHPTFWYLYDEELADHIHAVDAILGYGLDVSADGVLFSVTFRSRVHSGITRLDLDQIEIGILNEDRSTVVYVPSISRQNAEVIVGKSLPPILELAAAETNVSVGSAFTTEVGIENATGLSEIRFTLAFDPEYLGFMKVIEGDLLTEGNAEADLSVIHTAPGVITVEFQQGSDDSVSGTGTIAEIAFQTMSSGESALILKDADISGEEISIQTPSLTITSVKPDLNDDGTVDVFDLVLVGKEFGQTGMETGADINEDGIVNIFDLVLVARHFGETLFAASPPRRTTDAPEVNLELENVSALEAGLFRADIRLESDTTFSGFQFDLISSSDAIEIVQLKPGERLNTQRSGFYWRSPNVSGNRIEGIAVAALWPIASFSQPNAVIGELIFKPRRDTVEATFRFENIRVISSDLRYLQTPAAIDRVLLTRSPLQNRHFNNFPNPANPETWIPFQLEAAADVRVSIYDITGGLVRHIDLGHQSAGHYLSKARAVHWDGKNRHG